jgi:N-carbamoyl-L-amino-acid hydrolase
MTEIDGERLLLDLRRLAEIGRYKTGVHRPTYSPQDTEARAWLADRMREAGLLPVIDGVGNVIGRGLASGKRLLVGSHIETQPQGGWLDGALGVMYGVALARAGLAVDVGAWADEEGWYASMIGSRSFCDGVEDSFIDEARNKMDGTRLRDALAGAGLAGRKRERLDPSRYVGYLEAHIEQGDRLDTEGLRLGIVDGIVGICQYRLIFEGQQNHAGTTRMPIRKDAGVALVRLAVAIDRRFPEVAGPRSVWTAGRIVLEPGAPSVVPGRAEMLFQFRDVDPALLDRMHAALEALVVESNKAGPCTCTLERLSRTDPAPMARDFQDVLERAAERHAPGKHVRMPSAAGHDAQIFARHLKAGMLFIPSIGGISHHYSEDTSDEDIVLGARAFAAGAAEILARA